jgi:hypothetical protein
MASIRTLNWGIVPPDQRPRWVLPEGTLLALWPTPVDSDVCFCEAGFDEFADSDDAWDRDWQNIVTRTIDVLRLRGTVRLRNEADVLEVRKRRPLEWLLPWRQPTRTVTLSAEERIFLSTRDDRIPPAVVEVGDPPAVLLRVSDGHPLLWLDFVTGLTETDANALICQIAGGRPVQRRELRWDCLTGRSHE